MTEPSFHLYDSQLDCTTPLSVEILPKKNFSLYGVLEVDNDFENLESLFYIDPPQTEHFLK